MKFLLSVLPVFLAVSATSAELAPDQVEECLRIGHACYTGAMMQVDNSTEMVALQAAICDPRSSEQAALAACMQSINPSCGDPDFLGVFAAGACQMHVCEEQVINATCASQIEALHAADEENMVCWDEANYGVLLSAFAECAAAAGGSDCPSAEEIPLFRMVEWGFKCPLLGAVSPDSCELAVTSHNESIPVQECFMLAGAPEEHQRGFCEHRDPWVVMSMGMNMTNPIYGSPVYSMFECLMGQATTGWSEQCAGDNSPDWVALYHIAADGCEKLGMGEQGQYDDSDFDFEAFHRARELLLTAEVCQMDMALEGGADVDAVRGEYCSTSDLDVHLANCIANGSDISVTPEEMEMIKALSCGELDTCMETYAPVCLDGMDGSLPYDRARRQLAGGFANSIPTSSSSSTMRFTEPTGPARRLQDGSEMLNCDGDEAYDEYVGSAKCMFDSAKGTDCGTVPAEWIAAAMAVDHTATCKAETALRMDDCAQAASASFDNPLDKCMWDSSLMGTAAYGDGALDSICTADWDIAILAMGASNLTDAQWPRQLYECIVGNLMANAETSEACMSGMDPWAWMAYLGQLCHRMGQHPGDTCGQRVDGRVFYEGCLYFTYCPVGTPGYMTSSDCDMASQWIPYGVPQQYQTQVWRDYSVGCTKEDLYSAGMVPESEC